MNADIPQFTCLLRREYMYDGQRGHGEFEDVAVFGLASIAGRAIQFHVMTARGAQFARVPISALCWKKDAPALSLPALQLWDCPSYDVEVHEFEFLGGLRCRTRLRDGQWHEGEYLFTVDWFGNNQSEGASDLGHKNAHIIKLDNGCFAAQPNNRIFWYESSFVIKPFRADERPDYLTNTRIWRCEGWSKWTTEDSDKYFYEGSEK